MKFSTLDQDSCSTSLATKALRHEKEAAEHKEPQRSQNESHGLSLNWLLVGNPGRHYVGGCQNYGPFLGTLV